MSKTDLKNVFCLIPVRPADWNLVGIYWYQQIFIDTCSPFALRSAPIFKPDFNSYPLDIAACLWCAATLDDFFTAGPATSPKCVQHLQ